MRRLRVCAVTDLANGAATKVCDGGNPIAVFNVNGRYFATDDTCTHGKASLSAEGCIVEGDVVECGWHRGRFSLVTGKAVRFPAMRPVNTYRVIVEGDELFVEVEDSGAGG